MNRLRAGRIATVAALLAIVVLPLSIFLFRPHALLGGDYVRSYWITGYVANSWRIDHRAAPVFQTATSLGIALPEFSGVLLYRITGLVGAFWGPGVALRLAAFVTVLVEACVLYGAARALRANRGIALFVSLGAVLSTYALTDLYNRGEVPEYVALTLLGTAIGAWFWSLRASPGLALWRCRAIIAAALTLIGGSHDVTMILGGVTFLVCAALALGVDRRRSTLVTLAVAAAGYLAGDLVGLADFAVLGDQMPSTPPGPVVVFPDRIDAPIARFAPFPIDPQSVLAGVGNVSTPYLEAPLDYALLMFAFGVLTLRRHWLTLAYAALALGVAGLSIWPWFWSVLPPAFGFIQSAYRLTAYVNIFSLCAILSVLWLLPAQSRRIGRTAWPWIAATVAVMACVIKLNHATAVAVDSEPDSPAFYMDGAALANLSARVTSLPRGGAPAPAHQPPPGVPMLAIGEPAPQLLTADSAGLIFTRVLAFPWNGIVVDTTPVPSWMERTWKDWAYYAVKLKPGTVHRIQTTFTVPPLVTWTIRFTGTVVCVEVGAVVVLTFLVLRRDRRKRFS